MSNIRSPRSCPIVCPLTLPHWHAATRGDTLYRMRDTLFPAATAALLVNLAAALAAATDDNAVTFNRDVRPILADKCFACHGPDESHRKAGLRLDLEAEALGHVIQPGDPEESELIERIDATDADQRMPPPDAPKQLTDEERATLREWIAQGARWQQHWAFEPVMRPDPPDVEDPQWVRRDLDRFVLREIEAAGLSPSPEASPETLIRRLSLDLIGLPPTLAEIDAFVGDPSPEAYERLVDRLLESDHYGERMAMDWLDAARFADSNGYQNDFGRSMWPWRDWVINAFNENMPYDRFVVEQIAGDLLPDATLSSRIATGFNRNNRTVTEGGSIEEEWRIENAVDRVETTSTVFLGLTVGCARCHSHKYDPITHEDFYAFLAFFNTLDEKGAYIETRGNVPPLIQLPTPGDTARQHELISAIEAAEKRIGELQENAEASTGGGEDPAESARLADAQAELEKLKKAEQELEKQIPSVMVMKEMEIPRETYVLTAWPLRCARYVQSDRAGRTGIPADAARRRPA